MICPVLFFTSDVVQCLQSAGLQERKNIHQLSPELPGGRVARTETV